MKTGKRILSAITILVMLVSVTMVIPYSVWADYQDGSAPVSDVLLPKVVAKGKRDLVITWNKVSTADGYDVSIYPCEDGPLKAVATKTFKGNKTFEWTKKNLKKNTAYKVIVVAWKMKDGIKTPIKTTPFPRPRVHAYTSGGSKKYTNPKSVTLLCDKELSLNSGDGFRIEAKVNKLQKGKKLIKHDAKLRYFSTDDKVAKVSTTGKITAVAEGKCKIYVYALNGVRKTITVEVA